MVTLSIDGESVRVKVRRSSRASRYGLRIANATGEVILTVPETGDYERALSFLNAHEGWLARRLERRETPVPFVHGAEIPLRGTIHRLYFTDALRGAVRQVPQARPDDGAGAGGGEGAAAPLLQVPGGPDHAPRRLGDWLRAQARADLTARVRVHAAAIAAKPGRITVRDTASRWGSCSSRGGLSFSWRLVLAPPFVLDYVAAHEVAHLEHMNHSPRFWALTRRLFPETDRAEAWLKRHGRALHRYGREAG